jgi:hypothetical protein
MQQPRQHISAAAAAATAAATWKSSTEHSHHGAQQHAQVYWCTIGTIIVIIKLPDQAIASTPSVHNWHVKGRPQGRQLFA